MTTLCVLANILRAHEITHLLLQHERIPSSSSGSEMLSMSNLRAVFEYKCNSSKITENGGLELGVSDQHCCINPDSWLSQERSTTGRSASVAA
mmetsp:Transcript_27194/g.40275  ORF Transcript_27194/g.40275 Transcript_27194/m.40275 type:complete len:93 (-) Transcript_27194:1299-1577(-)